MSEPFVGEIRMVAFDYAPRGWALCNGQTLAINQNQSLFAVIGTRYGGNGTTTFALPDLRGRVAVHRSTGISVGQAGGEEAHVLSTSEIPPHTHVPVGNAITAGTGDPAGNTWAAQDEKPYSSASPDVQLHPGAIAETGQGAPHENRQPYLVVNYIIALQGVYPTPN